MLPRVEAPLASMRDAYPAAEKDLSAVRSRLIDAGLGCHKETVGLPDALGYQVVQRESFSVICEGQRVSKKGQFKEGYFLKGNDENAPLNFFLCAYPQAKSNNTTAFGAALRRLYLVYVDKPAMVGNF